MSIRALRVQLLLGLLAVVRLPRIQLVGGIE
jgi:hypothetical protein